MDLRVGVWYAARVAEVSFGHIPRQRLLHTLSSGRLCSLLLEQEIAARFGIETGTQGSGADLIDPRLGLIQAKSFRSQGDAVFRSGPHAGARKASVPRIWTTKSGFWDRRNRLSDQEVADAEAYILKFDHFAYIDISQMAQLRYGFVVIPATVVAQASDGFYVAEDVIRSQVHQTVVLP